MRRSATQHLDNDSSTEQAAKLEILCQHLGQIAEETGNNAVSTKSVYFDAMTHMTGTPMFMAPEQYTNNYSFPVDVWAFGLTMVRLFTLKWPFEEFNVTRLVLGVSRGTLKPMQVRASDVPHPDVSKLINQCLMHDPKKRPSFKEIEQRLSVALKLCRVLSKRDSAKHNYTSSVGAVGSGKTKRHSN